MCRGLAKVVAGPDKGSGPGFGHLILVKSGSWRPPRFSNVVHDEAREGSQRNLVEGCFLATDKLKKICLLHVALARLCGATKVRIFLVCSWGSMQLLIHRYLTAGTVSGQGNPVNRWATGPYSYGRAGGQRVMLPGKIALFAERRCQHSLGSVDCDQRHR